MKIYENIGELVGNTPLLRLSNLSPEGRILAKLEKSNPTGSAKDRVALSLIDAAEKEGKLSPGGTIIEPTSGNTGIGLAAIGAARGYRVILTMPDSMSTERIKLLAAYGAEIVLTEGAKGMAGAIEKAKQLLSETEGSFMPSQFDNPSNPAAHEGTTGPEIWRDTEGKADVLVATVGTGGTLCGTARYLKAQNPAIRVIAVEPAESPLLSGGIAAPHGIQGIGANFIPENYDASLVDEVMTVTTEQSYEAARLLCRREGILAGISSGAALAAALSAAEKYPSARCIVTILPDTGERYLSTALFE